MKFKNNPSIGLFVIKEENLWNITNIPRDTTTLIILCKLECEINNIPPCVKQIVLFNFIDEQYPFISKKPLNCKICYNINKEITLLYACKKKLIKTAEHMLINDKDKCKIDEIDKCGSTPLIYACKNYSSMGSIAHILIDQFANKCKPEQVNNWGCN